MSGASPTSLFDETRCELGEGPSYDALTDCVFWFDIVNRKLFMRSLETMQTRIIPLPFMASAIARVDQNTQLLVTENGLYLTDSTFQRFELHVAVEDDRPQTRSNDARTHPSGALWFSTMDKAAKRQGGAIYHYFEGQVREIFADISIANSICFSADGSIAYFTDTLENRLMRVETNPDNGLPIATPTILIDQHGKAHGIDGSVVDLEGIIWNARFGAGEIHAYAPDGRLLETIAIPARQATCPAFIGQDASRMIVTTAHENMDESQIRKDPLAGATFLLDRPMRGRVDPAVRVG